MSSKIVGVDFEKSTFLSRVRHARREDETSYGRFRQISGSRWLPDEARSCAAIDPSVSTRRDDPCPQTKKSVSVPVARARARVAPPFRPPCAGRFYSSGRVYFSGHAIRLFDRSRRDGFLDLDEKKRSASDFVSGSLPPCTTADHFSVDVAEVWGRLARDAFTHEAESSSDKPSHKLQCR